MASAASVTSLADEVNCPICQGTLREPVTIDCGHNFCRGCLTRYCEVPGPEPEEALACPLCKEPFRAGSFRPNWQLASVVENIERLRLVSTPGSDEADMCREHGEKIYFFCEDDEAQLCALCREAGEHRAHTVRFLDAAAEPYRVGAGPRGPGTVRAAPCRPPGRSPRCAAEPRSVPLPYGQHVPGRTYRGCRGRVERPRERSGSGRRARTSAPRDGRADECDVRGRLRGCRACCQGGLTARSPLRRSQCAQGRWRSPRRPAQSPPTRALSGLDLRFCNRARPSSVSMRSLPFDPRAFIVFLNVPLRTFVCEYQFQLCSRASKTGCRLFLYDPRVFSPLATRTENPFYSQEGSVCASLRDM